MTRAVAIGAGAIGTGGGGQECGVVKFLVKTAAWAGLLATGTMSAQIVTGKTVVAAGDVLAYWPFAGLVAFALVIAAEPWSRIRVRRGRE